MIIYQLAAIVAAVVLALIMGLHLLLATGLPLGHVAYGGQHRVLPTRLRRASLAAVGVLGVAVWMMLARAGLVTPGAESLAVRVAIWVFAGYLFLDGFANLMSRSPAERYVMTPAALLVAVCFVVVGLSQN